MRTAASAGRSSAEASSVIRRSSTPDHRILEQVAFMADFPAYSLSRAAEGMRLWYQDGEDARALAIRPDRTARAVEIQGDPNRAARVFGFGTRAIVLPPPEAMARRPHAILWNRYAGVRPVLFADPWEGLAWAVLAQQVNVGFAASLKRGLAERYGPRPSTGEAAAFPSPARLLRCSVEELRALKLSRQKAETLRELAGLLVGGILDLEAIACISEADASARLQAVKGVGPWTSAYCLARVVGHRDAFPAADIGLRRAWSRLTGRHDLVTADELATEASVWAGWRSTFAFWLWLSNRDPEALGSNDNRAKEARPYLRGGVREGEADGDR